MKRTDGAYNTSSSRLRSYALAGALGVDVDIVSDGGAPCFAIRVGFAGDLVIVDSEGTQTTIPAVLAGETIRVAAKSIKSAVTTAQKITVFW